MSQQQKDFEAFAAVLNYDLKKHEDHGFYLCRSTAKAWLVYQKAQENKQ